MIEDLADREDAPIMRRRTAKVEDLDALRRTLTEQGAQLVSSREVQDTYFVQPGGETLKLSIEDGTPYLVRLQKNEGAFDVVSRKQISDAQKCRADLASHYGVQDELHSRMEVFTYEPYTVRLMSLDGQGSFIVIEGETVEDAVFSELGIKDPEFIETSLANL